MFCVYGKVSLLGEGDDEVDRARFLRRRGSVELSGTFLFWLDGGDATLDTEFERELLQ